VYYHFNEWRKDGSWKKLWVKLLQVHRRHLNLSSVQLDGSHTLANWLPGPQSGPHHESALPG
jgi:hypothetical protein